MVNVIPHFASKQECVILLLVCYAIEHIVCLVIGGIMLVHGLRVSVVLEIRGGVIHLVVWKLKREPFCLRLNERHLVLEELRAVERCCNLSRVNVNHMATNHIIIFQTTCHSHQKVRASSTKVSQRFNSSRSRSKHLSHSHE